ncbi:hypothetical protein [Devosia ginsengisoli]|uniref:SGNH/GDSL hydrolase family protein n=1 Tax=Devosia ginsengisoli TaxID=400770 RepID=A0A5B8LTA9_9HYPH|nr:hypothetical protein [Devosia ginsengisoli]QDZ10510.1 hypothetical protein FPZ08_06955 [Devosia ginsengisoli]
MFSTSRLLAALAVTLATALATHTAYSWGLAKYASQAFTIRGPNLRLLPTQDMDLAAAYLNERFGGDDDLDVLFSGSSVTAGYPFSADTAMPARFAKLADEDGVVVANGATIGHDLALMTEYLCAMSARDFSADVLFIEIPTVNELSVVMAGEQPRPCATGPIESGGYLPFFLTHPWGAAAIPRLRDQYADRHGEGAMEKWVFPPSYVFTDADLEANVALAALRIDAALDAADRIAPRKVLFFSPVYRRAFDEQDMGGVLARYEALVLDACRQRDDFVCLLPDFGMELDINNFFNITHVNRAGGDALAAYLSAGVKRH